MTDGKKIVENRIVERTKSKMSRKVKGNAAR